MLAGRTIHIGQSYCALAQKLKLRISWRCNWYIGSHVLFRACAHGQDGGIHFKGDTSLQYQQCHPHCFVRESQKQQKWHHWSGKSGASFQRAWIIPVGILAGVLVGHTCNDDSKVECAAAMAARPLCSKQAERVPADIDVEQKGDDGVGRTCSDMVMMQQRSIRRAIAQARDLCQRLKVYLTNSSLCFILVTAFVCRKQVGYIYSDMCYSCSDTFLHRMNPGVQVWLLQSV